MRLSEKILDLRKKSGWSQEELAEKLDISRQSVSKWETGESVPDLDKIIRMSELWNVSTDYLLKEDAAPKAEAVKESGETFRQGSGHEEEQSMGQNFRQEREEEPHTGQNFGQEYEEEPHMRRDSRQERETSQRARMVSREEAEDFLALSRRGAPRIAVGVMLCILSPICLLLLGVLTEKHPMLNGVMVVSENVAAGVGMTVLLIFVAIAVTLFITTGMRLSTYEYMEKELLSLPQDVSDEIYDRKQDFAHTFRYSITIGVILCIIGVVPLMLSIAFIEEDLVQVIGVCMMLVFVSVGVLFMVHAGIIQGSFDKLLQIGDYTPGKKKMESISGAYWSVVVAIYLLISFTGIVGWDSSWIIFPVAGVLFGAVSAVMNHFFH